jgi:hypothetical protein
MTTKHDRISDLIPKTRAASEHAGPGAHLARLDEPAAFHDAANPSWRAVGSEVD